MWLSAWDGEDAGQIDPSYQTPVLSGGKSNSTAHIAVWVLSPHGTSLPMRRFSFTGQLSPEV